VRNVAFLTSAEIPTLTADDRLAVPLLEAHGVRVEPAVWTDDAVDYGRYDLVVVRSTWDWYKSAAKFAARLRSIERVTRVENREAWSWLDKRYLLRLAERGARVPPMTVVRDAAELERGLASMGGLAVIKPATAAAGHRTARFDPSDRDAARRALDTILADDVALLQPYFPEVATDGEWSLVFFGGAFSHALKKRPRTGEFRIHEEYGGTIERAVPPADVLDSATRALAASGETPLYARVDGIILPAAGGFCVTELELVEPELFLRMHDEAPARFADAIIRALGTVS
jgi:glutathione synthase/RimK-type ligase-like ATP-grasp enzyme